MKRRITTILAVLALMIVTACGGTPVQRQDSQQELFAQSLNHAGYKDSGGQQVAAADIGNEHESKFRKVKVKYKDKNGKNKVKTVAEKYEVHVGYDFATDVAGCPVEIEQKFDDRDFWITSIDDDPAQGLEANLTRSALVKKLRAKHNQGDDALPCFDEKAA